MFSNFMFFLIVLLYIMFFIDFTVSQFWTSVLIEAYFN